MATEVEIKFKLRDENQIKEIVESSYISPFLTFCGEHSLQACYLDTADKSLSAAGVAFRKRYEDGNSVYCIKFSGTERDGVISRREYEYATDDLRVAVSKMAGDDVPAVITDLLESSELIEICRTDFKRRIWLLNRNGYTAELSADRGTVYFGEKSCAVFELEIEFKAGDMPAFLDFCRSFGASFNLESSSVSKFERALSLGRSEA